MKLSRWLASILVCAAWLAFGPVASAHHSTAMFEWGTEKSLAGTIERYEWTQPHTFLWVVVPRTAGGTQEWGLEGMSPSWLGRRGWNRHSLSAGDKVTIIYYPLKDHRPGGFYVRVVTPDGRTLAALPQRPR